MNVFLLIELSLLLLLLLLSLFLLFRAVSLLSLVGGFVFQGLGGSWARVERFLVVANVFVEVGPNIRNGDVVEAVPDIVNLISVYFHRAMSMCSCKTMNRE